MLRYIFDITAWPIRILIAMVFYNIMTLLAIIWDYKIFKELYSKEGLEELANFIEHGF